MENNERQQFESPTRDVLAKIITDTYPHEPLEQIELMGDEVIDLMQKAYDMPRWIACSERLPEDSQDVLVGDLESDIIKLGFYNQSGWYVIDAEWFIPTQWQKLPLPPNHLKR